MLKKLQMWFLFVCVLSTSIYAQSGTITGTVTDAETGEPIPQAALFLEELQTGAATNLDGEYTIEDVDYGTYTLRISSVGFLTMVREITVDEDNNTFNFALETDVQQLEDVVVTAFGVSRQQKSIGYSVQDVGAEELARVDQNNIVGALAGKVAGVQVVGSTTLGGSERIRIRGVNGLSDGQPLFVVDGTPITNDAFTIGAGASDENARGRDLGNLASDIDLSNVENVSVLKGAAAAALYGNRASNGVILITTKKGSMGEGQPMQINYTNNTQFEQVYVLPEYQNQYAGGYVQSFGSVTPDGRSLNFNPDDGNYYLGYDSDSETYSDQWTGDVDNTLNYAADESWGPRMDGTMYRPWWSWFDHDFTGDGQSDFGTEIPLEPNKDNIRDFFDTGIRVSNKLSISGGSTNASYRAGVSNTLQNGVMPNAELNRTAVNFSGALSHNNKFMSRVNVNYVNTQAEGRPATGYSAPQGNPLQSFNQWFQRQLDMDKLKQYRQDDGTVMSWNIRSPQNVRPLYWDSPYFTVNENVSNDERDRLYGNYNLSYQLNDNVEFVGKVHLDTYSFVAEDRIASGGLEEDWYYVSNRTKREINYEGGAQFNKDFEDFSFSGYIGGNILNRDYKYQIQQTVGGLSTPNYFNIAASVNRPDVESFKQEKVVRSLFGTTTIGYKDMFYVDGTLRNDWSSALPQGNNSYLYYGLSGSFVFTELDAFNDQGILSFGKLRASIAQVGDDLEPYEIQQTYETSTPYGSDPTQTIPNVLPNTQLKPAISSDYEFGADLRFLEGKIRTDINYFHSVRENEIIELDAPGSSGFEATLVNAGEFTTSGWEVYVGATPIQRRDLSVDVDVNWATTHSQVNELAEGIDTRLLESAYFGIQLYAEEGKTWGRAITTSSYGGYVRDENGNKVIDTEAGHYALEYNKDLGSIIPDWNGGFNLGVNYKNFSLGAFIEFQKGGKFYSVSRMFNAYSGLGEETVGNNTLGNPLRDPVRDANGDVQTFVSLSEAADNSGGVLVEGVDESGNEVAYLYEASGHFINMFYNKEEWLEDASYVKLREISVTYNLPVNLTDRLPIANASVTLEMRNPLLIYTSVDGVDPSAIQNNANGFGFWEGGTLPGTRSIGFNVNIGF
ncbi:SusC/RagA family TonB-linked outer membrane protein [Gracilimonas mengyeensis]|uniref:TonB-linked outer membrane protein, SusC/RagA family n=1 Tax=Gracilimonas mengyeensis TaxID=1302730 RepID=A0A521F4U4_9BACT|nr:SusC/RagA family TonB-linked outer membrane protein [Gracilimonas mengyeensis]SMO91076.1 TonB-linked outer membrane protein, SusC/RagA family [Gracilimonas mengyeensis]